MQDFHEPPAGVHWARLRPLVLALLCAPLMALAGPSTSQLGVTATVVKRASLQVTQQPSSVVVTAADLARGYVDVAGPAEVTIRSNSLSGYVLSFSSQGDFFRQIVVKGLEQDMRLEAAGGMVTQGAGGESLRKTTSLELVFRFLLSESARQGVYAWPLHLSVAPL